MNFITVFIGHTKRRTMINLDTVTHTSIEWHDDEDALGPAFRAHIHLITGATLIVDAVDADGEMLFNSILKKMEMK
jgi:hypothetical protein